MEEFEEVDELNELYSNNNNIGESKPSTSKVIYLQLNSLTFPLIKSVPCNLGYFSTRKLF